MADLPIELWHSIFDCLELTDLSTCALVSKILYCALKAYRIQEIGFTRRVYYWFHYKTKPARRNFKYQADFMHASILGRSSFNFNYLRRLRIGRTSAIDLNVINRFVHLEELDIDLVNYEKKTRTLRLANLQVLYILILDHHPLVELDTPRLAKMRTFNLKKLMFVYPESVRCIHTFFHAGKLPMFRNLECLVFVDYKPDYDPTSYERFEEFHVTPLKKLKEIGFSYHYMIHKEENMRDFKRMTANILTMVRPDLKVYWFGIQISDQNRLTEYKRFTENLESFFIFHLRHFEYLKKNKIEFFEEFWKFNFNYSMSELSEAGFNLRSEEFISKLAKLSFRTINVSDKVVERELLMELIARSPNLSTLHFSNSDLSQSFFDQMAETVRLNGIRLYWLLFHNSSGDVLNYEFVTKLTDLDRFETDHRLPNELISRLLELPMMDKLQFSSGWFMTTCIERISSTKYLLNGKPLSLQKLLERFDDRNDSTVLGAATTMLRAVGLV